MNQTAGYPTAARSWWATRRPSTGTFVMAVLILTFGFYILYPVVLIFVNSFNIASIIDPYQFSFRNWQLAFAQPGIMRSIGNTFLVYVAYTSISFPLAVTIAWILARTRIPFSRGFEFMFWVSFMLPSLSTTVGWTFLLDPDVGFINQAAKWLPFVEEGPFNIYSVQGIICAHLFGNAISQKVMLLTPAFRNMDLTLEEASIVSGASNLRTMMRVTLPVMIPPMVVVFMLNAVRIFQSFETERILGTPIGFFVYSTKIFQQIRDFDPPEYGQATALASVTLILIAAIIPVQRWLLQRRQYTTVTSAYKPGLIHLGWAQPFANTLVVAVVALLTVVPVLTLVGGSFMTRVGFFQLNTVWTLNHWHEVLQDRFFVLALQNTLILSLSTALISPLLFSIVAYVLVRTKWRMRAVLDSMFWMSASIPGILAGLGLLWLFLGTPLLRPIFGTIWALILVTILQGKLTSTQLFKGVYLQMGEELEEASRLSGAGW
ncbi:MAG: ABC transporter permease subunit, partial [Deltaproteobacteria bacterium]|nr:ABC transporter permease subunit [Deltaproteobacteria bacterium]